MFSTMLLRAAAACALLVGSVNAHMVIRSPVPYGAGSLNNSPLEPDGSDFPCKQRSGVYDITKMNNMEVGVPQELAFTGGASHGGGSCQVSVTMDKEPTKDSDWRVIHSIIGGCPTNDTGNISGDPTYEGAATFEFSIPKGMPNGQYTLAWTWFNKIGNREMYMNCAPITVSGGSDNDKALSSLPAMFVANVPADECTTAEGDDVEFPNPGSSVETGDKAVPGKPTGPKCGASSPAGSYGSSTSDLPAATEAPSYGSQSSSAEYAAPSQAIPTYSGVVKGLDDTVTATTLATVTASGYSTAAAKPTETAETYEAPSSYSESQPASAGAGSGSNATSSSGGCPSGAVQCSSPGNVVCIGSSQWGLCNIDNCAVPRELATGTSCSGGVVSKRHVSRHIRNHLHHARKI